ncbi:MAG: molybdopterin oxidoreductase family protein [Verrucomicrobiales bacterium]
MSGTAITNGLLKAVDKLRNWNGALTEDLVLEPSRYGLGQVPRRLKPDNTTDMVCGFCSTGCGLTVHLKDSKAINLTPSTEYPVNRGMACPKGWEALTPLSAPDRGTTPLLRDATGELKPVDWDEALQVFTVKFKAIQDQFGAESVAFISTGQMVTEEMAYLGALAKFGMGMVHGDGNTRQCMATAATAYKQSFGFDAPPFTYEDFEQSDVILLIGSNLCIAHPILWQRVLANRNNPKIVVVDPRRTETASAATHHYPILPKSDLIFFYGLANLLIERGAIDQDFIETHTTGFADFRAHVQTFNLQMVAEATGLIESSVVELAEMIAGGKKVSFWWTMGVNQSHEGTRLAQAIINLALMTGNIGKPGTGANSITGQCNAMGSRLFSNTTGLLGGRDFLIPAHRAKVAKLLGLPEEKIPQKNSWAYDQILEGVRSGSIKGLWIIATNTLHSWIQQRDAQELFSQLDFLVVQDMYPTTETARRAHLYLPAAGWGEKEGTLINSERRIGMVKKVGKAPGTALSDFNIFKLVAHYWGCSAMFQKWSSPEAVFQILKSLSRDQPCDITGIKDYRMIDEAGGIQWPWCEKAIGSVNPPATAFSGRESEKPLQSLGDDSEGLIASCVLPLPLEESSVAAEASEKQATFLPTHRRLFTDGKFFHPDQRAKFIFEAPRPMPEIPDADFPFLLLTGRGSSAQWHTQTRTGKSDVLKKLYPSQIYVEINPADAFRLAIHPGEIIRVRSRRGSIAAGAFITPTIHEGQLFIPMHYATANQLTLNVVDPYSRQPSYKACAVTLEKIAVT